jgi:hypothetical protein
VVQRVAVKDNSSLRGDEHSVVDEVFFGTVGSAIPEWRVNTEKFFYDRSNVRKTSFVIRGRHVAATDNAIELLMGFGLDLWMGWEESEDPLKEAGSLRLSSEGDKGQR